MVLEVLADERQVKLYRDAQRLEHLRAPYPAQLEDLRGLDRATVPTSQSIDASTKLGRDTPSREDRVLRDANRVRLPAVHELDARRGERACLLRGEHAAHERAREHLEVRAVEGRVEVALQWREVGVVSNC